MMAIIANKTISKKRGIRLEDHQISCTGKKGVGFQC